MKLLFAAASILLCQLVWSSPLPEPACDEVFSSKLCDQFTRLDESHRVRRQLPPPIPDGGDSLEKQLLEKALLEKLKFLINIGLLKNIPLLGEAVHQIVENNPEEVSKALSGSIFALLKIVGPIILGR